MSVSLSRLSRNYLYKYFKPLITIYFSITYKWRNYYVDKLSGKKLITIFLLIFSISLISLTFIFLKNFQSKLFPNLTLFIPTSNDSPSLPSTTPSDEVSNVTLYELPDGNVVLPTFPTNTLIENMGLSLPNSSWSEDSQSFKYIKNDLEKCGPGGCYYEAYIFSFKETNSKFIESSEDDANKEWVVSSTGKWAFKIVNGHYNVDQEPVIEDLGSIYLKNMETGAVKLLGKEIYKTGFENKYIQSSYELPKWSPDSLFIAIINYSKGAVLEVINANAVDISESIMLGEIRLWEGEAGDSCNEIVWSPDSKMLISCFKIFSISPPEVVFNPIEPTERIPINNNWLWSPDSKNLLVVERDLQTIIKGNKELSGKIDIYVMDTMGKIILKILELKGEFYAEDVNIDAGWSPDGKKIVYTYNKHLFIADTVKQQKQMITAVEAIYRSPKWSPDGNKIIYITGNFNKTSLIKMFQLQ